MHVEQLTGQEYHHVWTKQELAGGAKQEESQLCMLSDQEAGVV